MPASLNRVLLLAALIAPLAPAGAATPEPAHGRFMGAMDTPHPAWFHESFLDFSDDIREAAAAGKRILLYVYQPGCPYCNRLVEHNFGQKDINEATRRHYVVIALNLWGDREVTVVDGRHMSEKEFARVIGVKYTPTLLFFDEQGNVVLRLNGYVPPHNFRIALDYASAPRTEPYADFFRAREKPPAGGTLNAEPFFSPAPHDLDRSRKPAARMLAVYFEQAHCEECDRLHNKTLNYPATRALATQFQSVQLDLWADTPVVTPDGQRTTARAWARALNVNFAPALVFFDENGREVARADGFLKNFHIQSLYDYVLKKAYLTEPEFQRFLQARAEALREKGIDVNIWD